MHIVVDAARAFAPIRTGTETYAFEVLRSMLAVAPNDAFTLYTKSAWPAPTDFPVRHATVKKLSWPPKFLWHLVRVSLALAKERADVFFAPAHTIPVYHPLPSVVTVHDLGFLDTPAIYTMKELAYHRWALWHAVRTSTKIIAVSNFTRDRLLARYPHAADKTTVVHHGFRPYDGEVSSTNNLETKKKFHIQKPYILFVGRLETKKNTHILIRAWSQLRARGVECQLVLVGVPGTGFGEVENAMHESRFAEDILLPGYVTQEEKAALYQGASVFAFPSQYEGFGFPMLEAMASDLPIVAANAGSLPEVGGDAALYVNPQNPEELSKALERVLGDEDLRQSLIHKGRARFPTFSWERSAQETLEVLRAASSR